MIEKPLQDKLIKRIDKAGGLYLHIPNRAFGKNRTAPECLKDFPDVQFCYGGCIYFIELGIMDGKTIRHKERKERQLIKGMKWARLSGGYYELITNDEELDSFLGRVGI